MYVCAFCAMQEAEEELEQRLDGAESEYASVSSHRSRLNPSRVPSSKLAGHHHQGVLRPHAWRGMA